MPDIVVYPYGPSKPVRIRWQSDTMPTDQDIEDIYASFAKGEVGKSTPSVPVNTGRLGDPNATRIGPEPRSSGTSNDWEHLSSFAGVHGLTVTGKNEKQGHNVNSRHYIGQAIDVRVRDKSPEEVAAFIKAAQAKGIRVVDERTRPNGQAVWTGPHLHLEIGDRNAFFGQQGTPQPTTNTPITNPNIVRDRPAPKIGFTAADYPASKVPAKAPVPNPNIVRDRPAPNAPVAPSKQVPNPALQQFGQQIGQPNVAQQFQKSIDIKTPEGKANAKKAAQAERRKPMASGSFTIPGIGPVRWIQRGPGFVADVPGLGTVQAPDPQSLAKKIHAGFNAISQQARTEAQAPNKTAYIESNPKAMPGNLNPNDPFRATDPIFGTAIRDDQERFLNSTAEGVKMGYLRDNEKKDLFNKRVSQLGELFSGAAKSLGGHTDPLGGTDALSQLVASALASPMGILVSRDIAASPNFTPLERVGAAAEVLSAAALVDLPVSGGITGPILQKLWGNLGNTSKFKAALREMETLGLGSTTRNAIESFVDKNPGLEFKGLRKDGKPIFSVKSDVGPVEQVAKVDHSAEVAAKKAELDARRAARTQPVPTEPKPVSEPSVTAPKATPTETVKPTQGQKEPWEMRKGEFVGNPRIYSGKTNVKETPKRVYPDTSEATPEPFLGGKYQIRRGQSQVAVYDGDKVIATYTGGDNLVVDPKYRRQGIATELLTYYKKNIDPTQTAASRSKEVQGIYLRVHKSAIESALKEGKPVPKEVLADYPDLAAKYGKKEPAVSTQGMTGKEPFTFTYQRNPEKAPKTEGFGQDVEPAGRYVTEAPDKSPPGWERGTITFNKPLRIEFGGGYKEPSNWKNVLSEKYGGKTGKQLSEAIADDGYDGIITFDKHGTQEIVDLSSFKPTPNTPKPIEAPIESADAILKKALNAGDVANDLSRKMREAESSGATFVEVRDLRDAVIKAQNEHRRLTDLYVKAVDLEKSAAPQATGMSRERADRLAREHEKAFESSMAPPTAEEIARDAKWRGYDLSRAYNHLVQSTLTRRGGVPMGAKEFKKVYDAATAKQLVKSEPKISSELQSAIDQYPDLMGNTPKPIEAPQKPVQSPETASTTEAAGTKPIGPPKVGSPGIARLANRIKSAIDSGELSVPIGDDIQISRRGKTKWSATKDVFNPKGLTKNGLGGWSKTGSFEQVHIASHGDLEELLRGLTVPENEKIWSEWVAYREKLRAKGVKSPNEIPDGSSVVRSSDPSGQPGPIGLADRPGGTGQSPSPTPKKPVQSPETGGVEGASRSARNVDDAQSSKAPSKLASVDAEIAAVKARRDARLKSTTTKGTKRSGHADFTKDDFNDALELAELYVKKVGYTFEQYAKEMVDFFGDGVKPHLKEIWDTHVPKTPEVPRVSVPKVDAKPGEDVTGVAKQVTGRDPMKGVTREEMDQIGKDALLKDSNIVATAVEKTKNEGKVMDETELSASAVRLRQIANKESEIRGQVDATKDSAELFRLNAETIKLETEREAILMATDYSLNRGFHRMGIAAQLVHKPDFSLGMLKAKAKAAFLNTVEVIPKHVEAKLASYASSIDRLNAELDAAKKQIHDLVNKGTFRRGTKENNVKRLRKFFGETSGEYTPMASKNTRQRGAVYTIPSEERDAMIAMRSLAKQLADDGAKNLDDIVAGIRKEVGQNIPEETIYRMLSDKYRKYLLESDVHRMDANRYLRDIQRGAEFKLRGPLEKSLAVASDILGSTARSMQAGWDVSAPFIQGRKGLVANPTGWFKAWENQLKAYRHGDEVVTRRLAEMERHPMYSRFVAAGGDKLLRRPGGHFSAQEETFANNFMRLASETMDKGGPVGKYNPANLYLKGLERSDAAFSAFMNDLTWDTFLKFSRAAPNDPAFLRDSVHNLGVIYGRGTGPIAEAIGRSKLGDVFYAPRYTLSQMQYAGTPIRALNPKAFETTAGRMQALKIYGTQAAAYGTLVALARLAGWDIETDLRSSDFGTVALPGGRRLDIFGKESQAYRLVANIFAGRVTKKNEYEKPSLVTASKSVGQFIFGKLAPGPRLPSDVAFGSFDPDKGATPFTMAEFGKRYLPLWVQQTLQNGDLATVPLAILGQDVSKNQKEKLTPEQRAKSHPMELPKIKAKPDPLGRPQDPKAQVNDGDVIREVQRLGIELKWPDTVEGESEEAFKIRAKKQGDAVRDAIRSQMSASLYKDATVTEKRELLKSEISRAKKDFNKDFNESEKTRKADERLKQIERDLATGRK